MVSHISSKMVKTLVGKKEVTVFLIKETDFAIRIKLQRIFNHLSSTFTFWNSSPMMKSWPFRNKGGLTGPLWNRLLCTFYKSPNICSGKIWIKSRSYTKNNLITEEMVSKPLRLKPKVLSDMGARPGNLIWVHNYLYRFLVKDDSDMFLTNVYKYVKK